MASCCKETMLVIDSDLALDMIHKIYGEKKWVIPDLQDAATFHAQEAMEVVDRILRNKNYNRNHERSTDELEKEVAQSFLMLMVTCSLAGIDLNTAFIRLWREYTNVKPCCE